MSCGTCELYTLQFPTGFKADYYRQAKIGRCTLERYTVRSPNSGKDCEKYKAAEDMEKRIKWMEGRK